MCDQAQYFIQNYQFDLASLKACYAKDWETACKCTQSIGGNLFESIELQVSSGVIPAFIGYRYAQWILLTTKYWRVGIIK